VKDVSPEQIRVAKKICGDFSILPIANIPGKTVLQIKNPDL
jgi:hypothetical protein